MPRKGKSAEKLGGLPKPKRAATPFILFCGETRPLITAKHPEKNFSEIGKELGALWHNASEDVKKRYRDQANMDKLRYQKDLKEYQRRGGNLEDLKRKSSKKKPPRTKPKKASTAFIMFSREMRAIVKMEHPGATFSDIGKIIGERWKAADVLTKEKYQKLADADKLRYEDEVKRFNLNGNNQDDSSDASGSSDESEESDDEDD
eukprot:TRINITY_DN2220_c0_g3_i1.p1 TRINITY_DN2220_c0_g3~~TRINITY_DN2220_c0_g3_i1.p1  ORF type:complete len:204 (-),score=68.57 TRINITY_DN2220_c0_g3_i1:579-1190(-)